jgi:hypothetical protein
LALSSQLCNLLEVFSAAVVGYDIIVVDGKHKIVVLGRHDVRVRLEILVYLKVTKVEWRYVRPILEIHGRKKFGRPLA